LDPTIASSSSAIQHARVEVEINWWCNADPLKIRMLRVEQKICIGGANPRARLAKRREGKGWAFILSSCDLLAH
jgi:hypothetical protein